MTLGYVVFQKNTRLLFQPACCLSLRRFFTNLPAPTLLKNLLQMPFWARALLFLCFSKKIFQFLLGVSNDGWSFTKIVLLKTLVSPKTRILFISVTVSECCLALQLNSHEPEGVSFALYLCLALRDRRDFLSGEEGRLLWCVWRPPNTCSLRNQEKADVQRALFNGDVSMSSTRPARANFISLWGHLVSKSYSLFLSIIHRRAQMAFIRRIRETICHLHETFKSTYWTVAVWFHSWAVVNSARPRPTCSPFSRRPLGISTSFHVSWRGTLKGRGCFGLQQRYVFYKQLCCIFVSEFLSFHPVFRTFKPFLFKFPSNFSQPQSFSLKVFTAQNLTPYELF